MPISPTQTDFLSTLSASFDGQLHLFQIDARMKKQLRQSTINKLMNDGFIEYGSGRNFRITTKGRKALPTPPQESEI